jgi:RNA polymerase sigma factor (sigma-70 family)
VGITAISTRPAATAYEQHRDYVLSVLSRRCGWLDRDEREEAFHDAYAVVLEKERDGALDLDVMAAAQVRAFLTQTAIHKGLDEGKRAHRKRSLPIGDRELSEPDAGRAPDEVAAADLESARVREIVGELSERRQAIVKLRYFFDRSPQEIQRCLGLSERSYRRELERAQRHILQRYELVREGSFCESRRSLIRAFVMGIAGPDRAREAREHLASCPGCTAWAAELREVRRQAAALAPLPALVLPNGPLELLLDGLGGLRDQLLDAGAGVKQQAASVATRVDQATAGYASSARPGAVAIAVAGCVTIGGGATYCSVEGLPGPMRGLAESVGVAAPRQDAEVRPAKLATPVPPPPTTHARPTPPARSAAAPRARKPAARKRAAAKRTRPPAPRSSPVAAAQEFGFETPAPSTPGSAPATPAAPPGEFDP